MGAEVVNLACLVEFVGSLCITLVERLLPLS